MKFLARPTRKQEISPQRHLSQRACSWLAIAAIFATGCTTQIESQPLQLVAQAQAPQEMMPEAMEDSQEISVPLVLAARFKVKPEKRQLFLELAGATLEPTRKEPGNISYSFYEESKVPNSFIYFEEWRSFEDLQRHLERPYTQRLLERFEEILDGEANIRIYDINGITYSLERPAM